MMGSPFDASAISRNGRVAGFYKSQDETTRAAVYRHGRMTDVGPTDGATSARDVNMRGDVTGVFASGDDEGGFIARGDTVEPLRLADGRGIWPRNLNEKGQVLGFAAFSDPNREGTWAVWQSGSVSVLGGDGHKYASALNNRGVVAGLYITPDYEPHAALWRTKPES